MSSLPLIALSGMNASQTRLQTSAHNLANLGTTGLRRQEVAQQALAGGGTGTVLRSASSPGPSIETDLVGLLQARTGFMANLAVFRTADQMAGSLLDALG
jgi:flagellar hook protein FlgE